MIILVDAYNVLKTVLHIQFVQERQRRQFLQLFMQYAQIRPSNQVLLIFDGGSDVYETGQAYPCIQLIYAGAMQSADDVIKKKLHEYQGYDVLLVTCDRELKKYALQYHIESMGSVEFYTMIQEVVHTKNIKDARVTRTIHKTSECNNDDLDKLMELASRTLLIKEQDKERKVSLKSFVEKTSKKDKKLLKKIAKI